MSSCNETVTPGYGGVVSIFVSTIVREEMYVKQLIKKSFLTKKPCVTHNQDVILPVVNVFMIVLISQMTVI